MLVTALALSACAGPTLYKPAAEDGDFGYSQQKLQENRYRITFAGNSNTDRETVQNYLLYRAAELTLEQGGDYFVVGTRDTERDVQTTYSGSGFSPFFFGAGFGGAGATNNREDFTAYGTITIRKGTPASDQENAYDAQQLKANLKSKIKRPQ